MKKLLILFVCLFTLQTIARADDDKPIQVSQMPQKAQQFIKQHFAGNNIAMAKVESDFYRKATTSFSPTATKWNSTRKETGLK